MLVYPWSGMATAAKVTPAMRSVRSQDFWYATQRRQNEIHEG